MSHLRPRRAVDRILHLIPANRVEEERQMNSLDTATRGCVILLTDVQTPIIDADFLTHYNLSVDVRNKRLSKSQLDSCLGLINPVSKYHFKDPSPVWLIKCIATHGGMSRNTGMSPKSTAPNKIITPATDTDRLRAATLGVEMSANFPTTTAATTKTSRPPSLVTSYSTAEATTIKSPASFGIYNETVTTNPPAITATTTVTRR
ncbi:hypothetical protein CSKR_112282 [Clonorchis sinensis]|uniref:Uncharacterized protein n=1 Tax=Clonorchis sinensis TaxID=79923 RepID=A0A3R7FIW3_CLOSI|nr:hypothetical protein CSKR_112282 [Clonorchis sinensis]